MTIKDIARQCGVSVSTVSRVLNDRPDVSPAVRAAVLEAVRSLLNKCAAEPDFVKSVDLICGYKNEDCILFRQMCIRDRTWTSSPASRPETWANI